MTAHWPQVSYLTCALLHAGRKALGQVLYKLGATQLLAPCTAIELQLPVMRLGNTIGASPTQLASCVEKFGIAFDTSTMLCYDFPLKYSEVQTALSVHIARRSAMQHAFVPYGRDTMGLFAGFIMHAFYKHHSNIRFHVMQFFEDHLHACYGLLTFSDSSHDRCIARKRFILPEFVPCDCAWKALRC